MEGTDGRGAIEPAEGRGETGKLNGVFRVPDFEGLLQLILLKSLTRDESVLFSDGLVIVDD